MNTMSRELALKLVKEKRRLDIFQRYHRSLLRVALILGLIILIPVALDHSIFLALIAALPVIGLNLFEQYWVKKRKAQGNLYFFSVINNVVKDSWKFPLAYTIQDLSPPETNRGNYVFLLGDRDWRWLMKRSWEKLFLHDGLAPHKTWQDYTIKQSVVLESGQATTIKFTFHFELTTSELMLSFLEQAFGRGLESFRSRILNVLMGQVHRVIGTFGRFKNTQDLFEKIRDRSDVAFSAEEMKKRLARSGLPTNIGLTHRHFEFQVCDHRSDGSRYKLWEQPNVTE